jgi:nucleoside-diphosphate-sugar epimerase
MVILITGADGFIGSNLASLFLVKGETILVLDNL